MNFLKKLIGKKTKLPQNLKEMFDAGMFSHEEFLRYKITQTEIKLSKEKEELAKFLKKGKK